MLRAIDHVQNVTIVDRRSGPGYRLVLRRKTAGGTPVLETLTESFASIASAEAFALESLGVDRAHVRIDARGAA
ncbi:MAG: hypothetical protein JWM38_1747 [Sphingomonas bacterium]|jgi:hypothetical protein|nr:hypothetical protein [Sphingomonas bacterium]MDB5718320.1 hypothetical protein [Sphingomonas bacterium]